MKQNRLMILTIILLLTAVMLPIQAQDTVIRWSIEGISDVVSLDPAKATDSQGFTVIGLLYAGLVRLDENLFG